MYVALESPVKRLTIIIMWRRCTYTTTKLLITPIAMTGGRRIVFWALVFRVTGRRYLLATWLTMIGECCWSPGTLVLHGMGRRPLLAARPNLTRGLLCFMGWGRIVYWEYCELKWRCYIC